MLKMFFFFQFFSTMYFLKYVPMRTQALRGREGVNLRHVDRNFILLKLVTPIGEFYRNVSTHSNFD
jgi:hypothetical protein